MPKQDCPGTRTVPAGGNTQKAAGPDDSQKTLKCQYYLQSVQPAAQQENERQSSKELTEKRAHKHSTKQSHSQTGIQQKLHRKTKQNKNKPRRT
ncbi:hypothetical protein LDENG_00274050 [Lucifuga dentata]|nr:hypothetical protein LDENG_00274050 [Lucifuga dentata]